MTEGQKITLFGGVLLLLLLAFIACASLAIIASNIERPSCATLTTQELQV